MLKKLFFSSDSGLLEFELQKIKEKKKIFYWSQDKNKFILEIDQLNFFYNEFTIVIKDFNIIDNKINLEKEQNLINYLISSKRKIIFISNSEKIEDFFVDNFNLKFIEIKKLNKWNIEKYIIDIFDFFNLKINTKIVKYLSENFSLNSSLIFHELSKLKAFSNNELSINLIDKIIDFGLEQKVFNLINLYLNDDINNLTKLIFDLEKSKEDFFNLINIFISQIYLLKLFIKCYSKFPNYVSISKKLKVPLYQVNNWSKFIVKFSIDIIENIINNLLELEIDIIKNNKNIISIFKLFLIMGVNCGN